MKKEMTMDEYIAICDRYEELPYQCGAWWPKLIDVKTKMEPKIEHHLDFLIWVAETANFPKTQEEIESRNYINKLLRETIVFIDETTSTQNDTSSELTETPNVCIDISHEKPNMEKENCIEAINGVFLVEDEDGLLLTVMNLEIPNGGMLDIELLHEEEM